MSELIPAAHPGATSDALLEPQLEQRGRLRRPLLLSIVLVGLLLLSATLGVSVGSAGWGWADDVPWEIVGQVRAPRVLAALGVGAALAVAGTLMQLLTRNPLADPYVMGISGGAALGAFAAMATGLAGLFTLAVAAGAAVGALLALSLLLVLSWRSLHLSGPAGSAGDAAVTLVLVGVMIGAACAAVMALGLSLSDDLQLRGMVFWLMGDLGGAQLWWPVWLSVALALALTWPHATDLDRLARGDAWAASLGVAVGRRRRIALVAAALATGAAVSTAGAVGFVGLVVPHALRLSGIRAARHLLPLSALGGASFVALADTLARTVVAPVQLPVGAVIALVGVPAFLWLLLHAGRAWRAAGVS